MLDFEMCDYCRIPAEDAQPILFNFLCYLDESMEPSELERVLSKVSGPEDNCASFMASSDEALFALAVAFREENRAAHLTLMWFLACCDYATPVTQLLEGLRALKHVYRHSGRQLKTKLTAAITSWEEIADADDQYPLDDIELMPASTHLISTEMTVIKDVGDPNSKDGREIKRRYGSIIDKPLPLKGNIGDVAQVHQQLSEKFPWAINVVDSVCGQLSLMARGRGENTHVTLPPILLVGNPGCGKTRFLRELCEMLTVPFSIMACGGTSDSGGFLPVARGWVNTRVAGPVQAMLEKECANPALILDEIDKASVHSQNGSLSDSLLTMLNGDQKYYDTCLMANVDFGGISFLATANSIVNMPEALKDRFMIVTMDTPSSEHFEVIYEGLRSSEARRLGVSVDDFPELNEMEIEELKAMLDYPKASIRSVERAYRTLSGDKALKERVDNAQAHVSRSLHLRA